MTSYIALDLETTGFDPENDQVIEIAAIKFEGNTITDTFETLVNPETEIPGMISHITGITEKDVISAPIFQQVVPKLLAFIDNCPIIGHNIDFDLSFLRAKGLPINNKQFDTFELASILLPGLPSYSLDTISRILKIRHEQKHRAMSDTHVCYELFNLLCERIKAIPPNTLAKIKQLLEKTTWGLSDVFQNIESEIENTPSAKKSKKAAPANDPHIENIDQLLDLYDQNSILSKIIPQFEPRPSQRTLTEKILNAFEHQSHLLAEAGTGTGKTFSYLLAAAYWSIKNQEKVIISTHTNNLQDQIVQKDFPQIQKLFPNLKITVLKGRKKYLSLTRFNRLKAKPNLADFEIIAIIKILLWLDHTETGDLDEVNLQNKELVLIDEICCSIEEQLEENPDKDFLSKARRKAEQSQLIVVNHALLIQDAINENKVLPQSEYLVIDEAHHLENVVTNALNIDLTPNSFRKNTDSLENTFALIEKSEHNKHPDNSDNPFYQVHLSLDAIKNEVQNMYDQILIMLNKYAKGNNDYQTIVPINIAIITTPEWNSVLDHLNQVIKNLDESLVLIKKLFKSLPDLPPDTSNELQIRISNLEQVFHYTKQVIQNFDEKITWLSKTYDENLHLHSIPINVSTALQQHLFNYKRSVILTSATLTTNNTFNYIRNELGLGEEFDEIQLPSNFSYPDQVKIIIPNDLPEPRDDHYIHDCIKLIGDLIQKNGGRSLILFTAKKELAKVFHSLAPKLKNAGFNLLGQSISGGRGKIISQFKDEPEVSAILGTNSFWEGVDILGEALNCVVIQKLPFDPPEDPIINARSSRYRRPFDEYSLPRAILKFKQGFGRLIRSCNDTGSVVILDSRLVHKQYGNEFLESLPNGISIQICPKNEVADLL